MARGRLAASGLGHLRERADLSQQAHDVGELPLLLDLAAAAAADREAAERDLAAYAEGAALPNPGAKLAGPTFEEWLAAA